MNRFISVEKPAAAESHRAGLAENLSIALAPFVLRAPDFRNLAAGLDETAIDKIRAGA